MTLPPEYIFYGIVLGLIVLIVRFVYWWWHDAVITTAATQIAHDALKAVGVNEGCSQDVILGTLSKAELDDIASRNLIVASLYLLRSDFHLNKRFFRALSRIPGYESSDGLRAPPALFDDIRHYILETKSIRLPKQPDLLDQAVDRLVDNLAELEHASKAQKIAA